MECTNCCELYNDTDKCPRNLQCGHTYCERCLFQIFQMKKRIECPLCRCKHPPNIHPSQLSKNYIAADLAASQREIQEKLLICEAHKKPMEAFCENCQINICSKCIFDHSGHKFVKQEHSVHLVKEKATKLHEDIEKRLTEIKLEQETNEEEKAKTLEQKSKQLKIIDDEFDGIIKRLNERRAKLKSMYEGLVNEDINTLEKNAVKRTSFVEKFTKLQAEVNTIISKFETTKVIQDSKVIGELRDIQDTFNTDTKAFYNSRSHHIINKHLALFDPMVYQEITNVGFLSKDIMTPKIYFFGEKNKILMYNILKEEWRLLFLPPSINVEFNYYSSSCTLPSGDVLITGGGISNSVYLFSTQKALPFPRCPMIHTRKEHASVFLNSYVYVLGGYDGTTNQFLQTCERYDLEKDKWEPIPDMVLKKCAFGACTLNNRYIIVIGGYDGNARLDVIERYDTKEQNWELLKTNLHEPLSNSACFSERENQLTILGGGYNHGFSLEVWTLNIEKGGVKDEWKEGPTMTDGRDLRNKLAIFGGEVYAIGGTSCRGEKYSLSKKDWTPMFTYQHLVNDNLDSWSCALGYSVAGKYGDNKNVHLYQNYHYDEAYDAEILSEEHDSSVFEDLMENHYV